MESTATTIQKQTRVNESKSKKPKPPTQRQYERARVKEALDFCPEINPCRDCGWPVVEVCCCNYCGSINP
jgi:hypothetical protein